MSINLISILGPTATGKTSLAVALAHKIGAEIISVDSRQVYRKMDIGTGKDIDEYEKLKVPYHLIDIAEPGEKYDMYKFLSDFYKAYEHIKQRQKKVVLCGGSGMYLEAILKGYNIVKVPPNMELRKELNKLSDCSLVELLQTMKKLHNTSDTSSRERLIRAIEIQKYYQAHNISQTRESKLQHLNFGIELPRSVVRKNITERLQQRLNEGMTDEVKSLLEAGVSPQTLKYYGLEYKFITMYLCREISYNEMFEKLNTAIHQFAKRQMTWFRRMEKNGITIHWINGLWPMSQKLNGILKLLKHK